MTFQTKLFCAAAVSAFAAFAATSSAQALTAQECSAKYQAAKTAGTLAGQKWNDFRKAQCGSDATAATPAATPAAAPAAATTETAAKPKSKKGGDAAAAPAAAAGPAVFPSAVDPKYSKETASKARMQTCAAQWKANKAANTTGGLRWIQKGGGYWSECNKKLKA
jgi:hypothetical protein